MTNLVISLVLCTVTLNWNFMFNVDNMHALDVYRPVASSAVTPPRSVPRATHPIPSLEVEALLATYFQPEDLEWALKVSFCESRWDANAKNPNSSASGLFQHLARFWNDRSAAAGWGGANIFDPVANTAVAAWLFYEGGGASHWNASRGCWG